MLVNASSTLLESNADVSIKAKLFLSLKKHTHRHTNKTV